MNQPQSPLREATELLGILAFLFGVGCYFASVYRVPVICDCLDGMAILLYDWIPALNSFKIAQAHQIVSSGAAAFLFFLAIVPFTPWIAFHSRVGEMESRIKIIQGRRKPRTFRIK
jgi:hypothetical protein